MAGRRGENNRKSLQTTIYLYCEGETEKKYCELIQEGYNKLKQSVTNVKKLRFDIDSSVDIDSEKECINLASANTDSYKFFIFDTEDNNKPSHKPRRELCKKLQNNTYKKCYAIETKPCIELWFLHHKSPYSPPTYEAIKEKINKEFFKDKSKSKYDKNKTFKHNNDSQSAAFCKSLKDVIKQELEEANSSIASKTNQKKLVNHSKCKKCKPEKGCKLSTHSNMPLLFQTLHSIIHKQETK